MICLSRARTRERNKFSLQRRSNPYGRGRTIHKVWCPLAIIRHRTRLRSSTGLSVAPLLPGPCRSSSDDCSRPSRRAYLQREVRLRLRLRLRVLGRRRCRRLLFSSPFRGGVPSRVFIDHHFPFVPKGRSKHPVGLQNREGPFPFPPPPSPIEAQRPSAKSPLSSSPSSPSSSSSVVGRSGAEPLPPPVWAGRCTFV